MMRYIILILLSFSTCLFAQKKTIDQKVDELLKKMTLEEKIGQMTQYNGFWDFTGPVPSDGDAKAKYDHIKQGLVGSMLNVRGVENVKKLQELAVKETRLGIPLIFGLDVIHGHKTLSPVPLAESASWDLEAIEMSARVAAIESSAEGINWTFAPMVDISRDARWGRIMEGAGEDPYLGSKIGVARIKGFQGDDLSAHNTIAACAKHFAGYGFSEAGRDYNTVDISSTTLYNVVLPPFKAAVDADVKTFMNSFNIINGVPATGNEFLQRDVLKGEWGFEGFIVSDWGSGQQMINHGFAKDLKQVAQQATNAGSDMDMESYGNVKYLKELVDEGKVDETWINDAARRILKVKFELGLFDNPYKYCDTKREKEMIYHDDHMKAALDMAKKSIVLLKNEKQLLPLKKDQQKIVVIGDLADDKTSPLGSWRVASDDNTAISVLEGLDNAGMKYTYESGPKLYSGQPSFFKHVQINETDNSGIKEAVAAAKEAEVVLMVLGEHGYQTGEGRSRTKIDLPGFQQELLEAVYAANKNVVLILMNGRPLAIPWAAENIPAILETWQLGTQTGNAISEVLLGNYNPSGKLPVSFPRNVGQCPIYYNQFNTGRPGPSSDVFWSHYADEASSPLYPFGFGLSYTTFEYFDLNVGKWENGKIKVSATVKNTGKYDGEEIVQLYIRDKVASIVRPIKELKGFEKIMLKAGESKTVNFELTKDELGFYNREGKFLVEPGEFGVMIGKSSIEGLSGKFELK